jgi:hypothetical protein
VGGKGDPASEHQDGRDGEREGAKEPAHEDGPFSAATPGWCSTRIIVEPSGHKKRLGGPGRAPRALPAPYSVRQELPDTLTPEEAEALPDDWFAEVVDADPSPEE